jgi:transketolase
MVIDDENSDIRMTALKMVNNGSASHIGSAFSMIEILNAVYKSVDVQKIIDKDESRDRVILSKGHGASGLYAVMFHHGLLSQQDIDSYFLNGTLMAGHASHFIDNVEHSTGALGHGLPVGLGIAIGSRSKNYSNRVFVIVGDGELHEGSNWEAIMYAGHKKVNNLCVLVDKNERSQMGFTKDACKLDPLLDKFVAFNFDAHEIEDGNSEQEILNVIKNTRDSIKPVVIICNTVKGKGVSFMEGNNVWHYRPPKGDEYLKATKELSRDKS